MKFLKIITLTILFCLVSCEKNPDNPIDNPTDEPTETAQSEYITQIFDYVYAPGQHADLVSLTDTAYFTGNPAEHDKWLYLGGFGGYVIAGFDHNIKNHEGADFEVFALPSVSPEPAIVYVMADDNKDGLPNDTWYELKGNQTDNSKRNYWLRYYRPKNSDENIRWRDSEGAFGELISGYNTTTTFGWWHSSQTADSITFFGTRLPDAYENEGTDDSQYWVVPKDKFTWGYAKNNYGTDYNKEFSSNSFDISNAIDNTGKSVELTEIRFIKIQTAVFQQAGWLNEVSTEVRGAKEIK